MSTAKALESGSELSEFKSATNKENQNGGGIVYAPVTPQKSPAVGWRRFIGIGLAFAAGLCMSGAALFAKLLSNQKYDPVMMAAVRYLFYLILGPILVAYTVCVEKKKVFDTIWPLQNAFARNNLFAIFLRATFGTLFSMMTFYSYKYMTVADSSTIMYSNAIVTLFLARLFLHERLGIVPVLMAILAFCGIIIISRPPILTGSQSFDQQLLIGIAYALGAMLSASLVFITLRYMRKVNYTVIMTLVGYMGVFEIVLVSIPFGITKVFVQPKTGYDFWYMIGLAFLTFAGQLFSTIALKYETTGPISVIRTCDIVFTFVLQSIFLGVHPDLYSLVGGLIVLVATLVIGFRKWLQEVEDGHPTKKRFKILLR